MKLLGSIIYVTSTFYRFVFEGSFTCTLDSLLFCIFMIHPVSPIFKMGCSIRMGAKSWRNCVWTGEVPM